MHTENVGKEIMYFFFALFHYMKNIRINEQLTLNVTKVYFWLGNEDEFHSGAVLLSYVLTQILVVSSVVSVLLFLFHLQSNKFYTAIRRRQILKSY